MKDVIRIWEEGSQSFVNICIKYMHQYICGKTVGVVIFIHNISYIMFNANTFIQNQD